MSKAKRVAYGDGSIYERKDGRWAGTLEGGVTDRGTRRRITIYGRSEAEVIKKRNRRRGELERAEGNATAPDAARKTVHSWGVVWLPMRQETKAHKTYEASATAVRKYIDPAIGRKRLVDISVRDLRAVDAKVRAGAGGEPAVAKTRSVLLKMLRDAIAEGYAVPAGIFEASVNTTGHVSTRPSRDALPTAHAIAVLGAAAALPHGSRWLAGFYQGFRQGEALGLTWDALDFDRCVIRLEWQLQPLPYRDKHDHSLGFVIPRGMEVRHLEGRFHLKRPKTAAGYREPPMTDTVRDALLAWREVWPENPHGLVWARPNGWPIDKADDAEEFRQLQVAAGVKKGIDDEGAPVYFTGHEMRNTCATLLAEAGVDQITIQAILGHSSFASSQIYIKARQQHMRAALAGVEAAYLTPPAPRELG